MFGGIRIIENAYIPSDRVDHVADSVSFVPWHPIAWWIYDNIGRGFYTLLGGGSIAGAQPWIVVRGPPVMVPHFPIYKMTMDGITTIIVHPSAAKELRNARRLHA